jgi:glucan biosynthesis protein C
MVMLFLFHNAHLFDAICWHIKNKQQSFWATAFVVFVHLWSMPLLLLLAGASTWFARSYKKGTVYIKERFKRLMIPFVFGILILVPPQIYVEGLSKSRFQGSFFYNYPHLFAKDPVTFDPQVFSNYGHHLWFLAFLFLFSLMDLPLSLFLRSKNGLRLISRLAAFLEKKVTFYGQLFRWR